MMRREKMTKKHFIAIAQILKELNASEEIVDALMSEFKTINRQFDKVRFKEACGIS
jgi:hypothetical protein